MNLTMDPFLQIEFYTLEYATALSSGGTTWQLAFDYYAACPHLGEPSAIALLESKMQVDEPQSVQKLLRICSILRLADMKAAILESQGQICLQVQKYNHRLQSNINNNLLHVFHIV